LEKLYKITRKYLKHINVNIKKYKKKIKYKNLNKCALKVIELEILGGIYGKSSSLMEGCHKICLEFLRKLA
jgi:hypothetical protein